MSKAKDIIQLVAGDTSGQAGSSSSSSSAAAHAGGGVSSYIAEAGVGSSNTVSNPLIDLTYLPPSSTFLPMHTCTTGEEYNFNPDNLPPPPSYSESTAPQHQITDPLLHPNPPATTTDPSASPPPPAYDPTAPNLPPPPEFTVYIPETRTHYLNKHLITHDPHLNTDGEALHQFLLSQLNQPPRQYVRVHGHHTERHHVRERNSQGRMTTKTQERSVTDFMFGFELTGGLEEVVKTRGGIGGGRGVIRGEAKGTMKVVGDEEKVFRGGMCKSRWTPPKQNKLKRGCCGNRNGRAGNSKCTSRRWLLWGRRRRDGAIALPQDDQEGLLPQPQNSLSSSSSSSPEITDPTNPPETVKPDSTVPVREWCDRYCELTTPLGLKEFIVRKPITNLNTSIIESHLTNYIRSTGYRGTIQITFPQTHHKIAVYPDTWFARWRQNPWVRWFFYLTFFWIITWPLLFLSTKKFHTVVQEWKWGFVYVDVEGEEGGEGERKLADNGESEMAWCNAWRDVVRKKCRERWIDDGRVGSILGPEDWRIAEEEERTRRIRRAEAEARGVSGVGGAGWGTTGNDTVDRAVGVLGGVVGLLSGRGRGYVGDDVPWGGDEDW